MMRNALRSGQSLIEVIVAMGIFVLFVSAFAHLNLGAYDGGRQGREQTIAAHYAMEGLEATRSIAQAEFTDLSDGTYGLDDTSGVFAFSGSTNVLGKYTRTVEVASVQRNASDQIVPSGGTVDADTKQITSTVTWNVQDGRSNTVQFVTLLTNWGAVQWVVDLLADFTALYRNSTATRSSVDGEGLMAVGGDLTAPSAYFSFDASGSADISDMHIDTAADRLYATFLGSPHFRSYDISHVSGQQLTLSGSVNMGASTNGFVLGTNYAYVLTNGNSAEVRSVRLSDMQIVSTVNLDGPENPYDIWILESANRIYIAREDDEEEADFAEIDISNPESLSVVEEQDIGTDVNGISASGGYAYLVTDSNSQELIIMDLSDHSTEGCNLTGNENATSVHIVNNRLFIGRNGTNFDEFLEFTLATTCAGLGSAVREVDLPGDVLSMHIDVNRNLAFIAIDDDGEELQIVNLHNNSVTTYDAAGAGGLTCGAVTGFGNYVYLGCEDNTSTIQLVQGASSGWGTAQIIGDGNTPGSDNAYAVAVSGAYIFVGTRADGNDAELFVFDASGGITTNMSPVASLEIGADVNDMVVDGNTVYLATSNDSKELVVVNVTLAPILLVELGSYNADEGHDAEKIALSGSTVFLGTRRNNGGSDRELYAIDVSAPALPSLLGTFEVNQHVFGLEVNSKAVFVGTPNNSVELRSVDASNPASMSSLDTVNLPGNGNVRDVLLLGDTLIIARDNNGSNDDLHLYDVSNPSNMTSISSLDLVTGGDDNLGLAVDTQNDQYLFVASNQNAEGLTIVDISNQSSPSVVTTLSLSNDDAWGVAYDGTYVYAATSDNNDELQIVGQGESLQAYPRLANMTSLPFDSENASTSWNTIAWTESGSGSLQFRIRTASTQQNLKSATWVGSDGTKSTTYTNAAGESITTDTGATGTRWIQWKAYFDGNGSGTTVLEDVTISY